MKEREKISNLQLLIADTIRPLIDHDYWLLNVPYHTNIGDTLIWQGELDFLEKIPFKCKGICSYMSAIPTNIKPEEIILLHGGGNFGDIWPIPHEWAMNVIRKYPNNKTLFFPQTVWFEDEENMHVCAHFLAQFNNLTICARDKVSYDILKSNFSNNILLVPDMVFCINMTKWKRYPATKDSLLLKRIDIELKETNELERIESSNDISVADWPTFTEESWQKTWFRRTWKYMPCLYNWYARAIFRPYLIDSGIKLIDSYKKIYSTRLHAAILCILLGKASDLVWLDNSYGKNRNFYETWLGDVDGITFLK